MTPESKSKTKLEGLAFLRTIVSMTVDPLKSFVDLARDGGDIVHLRFRGGETYLVNHPDVVRHILVTNQANYVESDLLEDLRPFLGRGILMSSGNEWLRKRRLLNPVVHRRHDAVHVETLRVEIDRMRAAWKSGQTVDVQREMSRMMLHVMVRSMFAPGLRVDVDGVIHALEVILEHASIKNNLKRRIRHAVGLNGIERSRSVDAALGVVDAFIFDAIHRIRAGTLEPGRLLRHLLRAEEAGSSTEDEIRDEMATFLFAGFDTTAGAVAWAIYLLARHPDAQERARSEASSIDDVSPDRIDELTYTHAVFLEAIRLFPPAWSFHRKSIEPDRIGEHAIPRNAHVMICPYAMHRHPAHWRDPEAFCPTRFIDGKEVDPFVSYAYIPFSHGGRACLGRRLAMLEARVILASLVRTHRFEAVTSRVPKIDPGIILQARDGLPLRVTRLV